MLILILIFNVNIDVDISINIDINVNINTNINIDINVNAMCRPPRALPSAPSLRAPDGRPPAHEHHTPPKTNSRLSGDPTAPTSPNMPPTTTTTKRTRSYVNININIDINVNIDINILTLTSMSMSILMLILISTSILMSISMLTSILTLMCIPHPRGRQRVFPHARGRWHPPHERPTDVPQRTSIGPTLMRGGASVRRSSSGRRRTRTRGMTASVPAGVRPTRRGRPAAAHLFLRASRRGCAGAATSAALPPVASPPACRDPNTAASTHVVTARR